MWKWLYKFDLIILWDLEFDYYYWMVYMKFRGFCLRYLVWFVSNNIRFEILVFFCLKVMVIKVFYCVVMNYCLV